MMIPYEQIPHTVESVELSLSLSLFFVKLARRNQKGRYMKIQFYLSIYTYPMMVRGGAGFEHHSTSAGAL